VDISGLEHVFIHEDSTFMEPEKTPVKEEKKNFIASVKTKISSWFKSGSPSV
jgi:hypothetical protein